MCNLLFVVFCVSQVIQVLSAYSADMGVINLQDCTALHYAAVTGDANCCKFLAQRGAVSLTITDIRDVSAVIVSFFGVT